MALVSTWVLRVLPCGLAAGATAATETMLGWSIWKEACSWCTIHVAAVHTLLGLGWSGVGKLMYLIVVGAVHGHWYCGVREMMQAIHRCEDIDGVLTGCERGKSSNRRIH